METFRDAEQSLLFRDVVLKFEKGFEGKLQGLQELQAFEEKLKGGFKAFKGKLKGSFKGLKGGT